jgi:hypothetical protein
MNKYIAVLIATSLYACASAPVVAPKVAAVIEEDHTPILLEIAGKKNALAIRCSDELSCVQQLFGRCANGYKGGELLHAGNDKVVGIVYQCITDEEVARRVAQEKMWEEEERQDRSTKPPIKK